MAAAEHYYTARPTSRSRLRRWTETLRGRTFTFVSDAGVFSASRVDPGTRLLIESVELPEEGHILDLGCGYGVLGIVCAACAPRARVTMVDVNERAVELARRNAALNGVPHVEVLVGDGFTPVAGRRFHLIVTNPPWRLGKEFVGAWLEQARRHLYPGGRLALVVRTKQGARSWYRRLEDLYGSCRELAKGGGYRVYEVAVPGGDGPGPVHGPWHDAGARQGAGTETEGA